jgi:hypothetical protein
MPAEYFVYIDWNNDGDFSDTRENVTSRTLDGRTPITVRYGRDQARALSPTAVGEAGFELNNQSRDFSPENTSSPLVGLVQPGRSAMIQAVLSATTYTIFSGHLDDFKVKPGRDQRSIDVTCLDPLARLKGVQVSTPIYSGLRTGAAIGLLLDAVGWSATLRDLDAGATVMPWWWADNSDAYDALMQIVDSEGPAALVTVDSAGQIVFRDRHHRLLRTASRTVQSTWRSSGAVEPLISAPADYNHGWKEIINSVSFDVPVRVPSGELSVVWSSPGRTTISAGETILISARGSSPFLEAVVPEVGTDYQLVSGTIEVALFNTSGESTTVSVKAVGGTAVVDDLQVRGYALATVTTVVVSVEDSVSIGKYGRRSPQATRTPIWAGVHDAKAIADLIVGKRAERLPTITVTMVGGNTTRLLQQLSRNLSDRVHVAESHTGLDADCWIEQISHAITDGGLNHSTTFGLEKVPDTVASPFTFDVAGRGFNDGKFVGTGADDPTTMFLFDTVGQGFDQGVFAN